LAKGRPSGCESEMPRSLKAMRAPLFRFPGEESARQLVEEEGVLLETPGRVMAELEAPRLSASRRSAIVAASVVSLAAVCAVAACATLRASSGSAIAAVTMGAEGRPMELMAERRKAPWECSWDGFACSDTRCCSKPGSRCYQKNDFWAACRPSCEPGEEMEGDEAGGKWSCKPLSEPAPPLCSWEDENCKDSGCCRRQGFTCYERDESWGRCGLSCDHARTKANDTVPWSCRALGGDVGVHLIQKSSYPAGTSLYCFTVVTPKGLVAPGVKEGYEQSLLEMMSSKKVGIFRCNATSVFEGKRVHKGDWQSVVNTDIFLHAWSQVKAKGAYKEFDWTVKADADAVFFPHRLRMHLASMGPPASTPVYLQNINFKFHFMGALEVLSSKAVDILLQSFSECSRSFGLEGGEDYFTKQCLDAAFVGHMTDFSLLDDKYTHSEGWHLFDVSPCVDQSIVAFHPYKHANSWEGCYNVSVGKTVPADYVGCNLRWTGDACYLNSTLAHLPDDPENLKGVVRPLRNKGKK